jgi:protein-S-isoprenylcysteine O-methyltransferase Ste14
VTFAALSSVVVDRLLIGWLTLAAIVFVVLLFVAAPYGRHLRPGWGPVVSARVGWFVMEIPAVLVVAVLYGASPRWREPSAIVFFLLWQLHYVPRAVIEPMRAKHAVAVLPVVIVVMGACFNVVNGCLQGAWLFWMGPERALDWLVSPTFLAGAGLFLAGIVINRTADAALRALRPAGETGYRIPRGGLYELVSCPNYLGEIVQWLGWALATWSLPGVAFALWTIANLLPRALAHHRWYRARFADYPAERRALIPLLL